MKITFKKPNRTLARRLETERLILEPLGMWEAFQLTKSWRTDPEILDGYFHSTEPLSLLKWFDSGPIPNGVTQFGFAIVPKELGRPIGVHMVRFRHYRSAYNSVALSDRDWWGKGVVVEARAKLMNHFFKHGGIERFCGSTGARNTASVFNYRRLGYAHVGTWHRHRRNPVTGEIIDILNFEMMKDQWMAGPFAERDNV